MKKSRIVLVALMTVALAISTTTTSSAQALKSKIQITVMDGLGSIVEGAEVNIYATEADYKSSENSIFTGSTDKKARVKFKGLAEGKVYFLDVRKGDLNNDGRAVQTNALTKGTNRVNIIIE